MFFLVCSCIPHRKGSIQRRKIYCLEMQGLLHLFMPFKWMLVKCPNPPTINGNVTIPSGCLNRIQKYPLGRGVITKIWLRRMQLESQAQKDSWLESPKLWVWRPMSGILTGRLSMRHPQLVCFLQKAELTFWSYLYPKWKQRFWVCMCAVLLEGGGIRTILLW